MSTFGKRRRWWIRVGVGETNSVVGHIEFNVMFPGEWRAQTPLCIQSFKSFEIDFFNRELLVFFRTKHKKNLYLRLGCD